LVSSHTRGDCSFVTLEYDIALQETKPNRGGRPKYRYIGCQLISTYKYSTTKGRGSEKISMPTYHHRRTPGALFLQSHASQGPCDRLPAGLEHRRQQKVPSGIVNNFGKDMPEQVGPKNLVSKNPEKATYSTANTGCEDRLSCELRLVPGWR
jgi:hypothetical protein